MGDVADILGFNKPVSVDEPLRFLDEKPKHQQVKRAMKPKGMSREVFMLQGYGGLIPAMPAVPPLFNKGFKDKRLSVVKGKWVWEAFQNPARKDKAAFYHWTKAENVDTEYPWAKFNTHLDVIDYSDEEYDQILSTPSWTRQETDMLVEICYQFDLRWPIIYDRYESTTERRVEDLQSRFFDIISKIKRARASMDGNNLSSSKSSDPSTVSVDVEYEKNRRLLQEEHFLKFKDDDGHLSKVKDEIKALTASLKKNKRTNKNASTKLDDKQIVPSAEGVVLEASAITLNVQPTEGKPCLQSSRLLVDAKATSTISKGLMQKMHLLLSEVGLPTVLLPTKASMDLQENIRKNSLGLLSIQTAIKNKQRKVDALRAQLGEITSASICNNIQLPRDSFLPAVTGVEDDTIINVVGNVNSKRKVAGNPKKKKRGSSEAPVGVAVSMTKKAKVEGGGAGVTAGSDMLLSVGPDVLSSSLDFIDPYNFPLFE